MKRSKRYGTRTRKNLSHLIVEPSRHTSIPEARIMAFITQSARENRYNPDEDPVLKNFENRIKRARSY